MEEFGWIILFFLFWVFSSIGDFRKEKRRKRRPDEGGETGPQAGKRGLASDIEEGARWAEEALRRWEARQRAAPGDADRATGEASRRQLPNRREFEIVDSSMSRERERARRELRAKRREAAELERKAAAVRRETEEERKDAYEAIAGMLGGREVGDGTEIGSGAEIGAGRQPASPRTRGTARRRARATETASGMPLARSAPMGESGVGTSPAVRSTSSTGLGRLDRLPSLQRAIVLREVLGPPKALSPGSDLP